MTKTYSTQPRRYRTRDGWDQTKKRWRWRYKGERISFTASSLIDPNTGKPCPPTKEGSVAAAKAELKRRKGVIDAGFELNHPLDEEEQFQASLASEIEEDLSFANRNVPEFLPSLEERKRQLNEGSCWPMSVDLTAVGESVELLRMFGVKIDISDAEPPAIEMLFGNNGALRAAKRACKQPAFDPQEQVSTLFNSFIDFYSKGKKGRGQNLRQALQSLERFRSEQGYPDSIRVIDDRFAEGYYKWIQAALIPGTDDPYSPYTQRAYFGDFKRFLRYLGRRDSLNFTPLKFMDQNFEFDSPDLDPRILSATDLSKFLGAASNQLRLHILLALNCGCNQADLGSLETANFDPKTQTLRYKRVKTKRKIKGDGVVYPLWGRTCKLLLGLGRREDGLLLVNSQGRALNSRTVERNFSNLAERLGLEFSFGDLRNTGANAIHQAGFGAEIFDRLFLQHKASNYGEKHYVQKVELKRFEEAMRAAERRLFPEGATEPSSFRMDNVIGSGDGDVE